MIHAGNNGNIGSHTFQVLKTNKNHVRGRFMISGKIQWGQTAKANSVGPFNFKSSERFRTFANSAVLLAV